MKVWFGATSFDIENQIEYYRNIRDYLKSKGCIILFDWIDEAFVYKTRHPFGSRNIKLVYQQVTQAISSADASVIEYTIPNFSSSHQILFSLHKKKPVLVMRRKKDNTFSDSYIEALNSPLLTLVNYTDENIQEVIDGFLGDSQTLAEPGRYNIVLDKKIKYYLDWSSEKQEKSRSQIIRETMANLIKNDKEYRKYLKS